SATSAASCRGHNIQAADTDGLRGPWSPSPVAESGRYHDRGRNSNTLWTYYTYYNISYYPPLSIIANMDRVRDCLPYPVLLTAHATSRQPSYKTTRTFSQSVCVSSVPHVYYTSLGTVRAVWLLLESAVTASLAVPVSVARHNLSGSPGLADLPA